MYSVFNNTTGEVFEDHVLGVVKIKSRHPFAAKGFVMVHQGSRIMQTVTRGMTHRVWHVLVNMLDNSNKLVVTHDEIAEVLGVKRPQVSIAMGELEQLNVLIPDEKKNGIYTMNEENLWKGKTKDYPWKTLPRKRSRAKPSNAATAEA